MRALLFCHFKAFPTYYFCMFNLRYFSCLSYYPCDKRGYCNRELETFPANYFVYRTHWTSRLIATFFHNALKFSSVRGQDSLVVTNMPGTAKDLFLFSNGKCSVSNKIVGQLFVCICVVGLLVTSLNYFIFLRAFFFIFVLCLIYSYIL